MLNSGSVSKEALQRATRYEAKIEKIRTCQMQFQVKYTLGKKLGRKAAVALFSGGFLVSLQKCR